MGLTGDVHVEIGELVLEGFDHPVDVDLVSAAFAAELARLVRLRGVPIAGDGSLAGDGEGRELDTLAGLPRLGPATSPQRLGVALARSVHAGLCGQGREIRGRPR